MTDPDLDPLSGNGYRAAAADPPINPQQASDGSRCGAGRAGITQPGPVSRGERVRQRSQHGAVVVEQVQDAVVEAGGDPASGQVIAERVLPSGQSELRRR